MQLLFLLLLATWLACMPPAIYAQSPQPVVQIAAIIHGPEQGDSNYAVANNDPIALLTPHNGSNAQIPFLAAFIMWQELLTSAGGLRVMNASDASQAASLVAVNITYFNVGPAAATNVLNRTANLAEQLASGGLYTFVLAPAATSDTVVVAINLACETGRRCIAVASFNPTLSLWQCREPLPDDCTARGLRAGQRRWSSSVSALASSVNVLENHASVYRSYGLRRAAVLAMSADNSFVTDAYAPTLQTMFDLSIAVPMQRVYNTTLNSTAWRAEIQQMIDTDVDGLFIISGALPVSWQNLRNLMLTMYDMQWFPKSFSTGGSGIAYAMAGMSKSVYQYASLTAPWDPSLRGVNYREVDTSYNQALYAATDTLDSPQVYMNTFYKRWNNTVVVSTLPAVVLPAIGNHAVTFIQKCVELAGVVNNPASLMSAGRQLSLPSVMGVLQLDPNGMQVTQSQVFYQYTPFGERLVYPLSAATYDPVYPAPTFAERQADYTPYVTTFEIVLLAIEAAALLFCLLILAATYCFKEHEVIRAASTFSSVTVSGAVLVTIGSILSPLQQTTAYCVSSNWFWTVGVTLMYASILVRHYRIYLITRKTSLKQSTRITEKQLYVMLLAIVSFPVIVNLIWSVGWPFEATLLVTDIYRPSTNLWQCSYRTRISATIFIIILMTYFMAVLLLSAVFSFLIRKSPSLFSDSQMMAYAVYNTTVLVAVIAPLRALRIGDAYVMVGLQSMGFCALAIFTVAIIFVPKFYLIYQSTQSQTSYTKKKHRQLHQMHRAGLLQAAKIEGSMIPINQSHNPQLGAHRQQGVALPLAARQSSLLSASGPTLQYNHSAQPMAPANTEVMWTSQVHKSQLPTVADLSPSRDTSSHLPIATTFAGLKLQPRQPSDQRALLELEHRAQSSNALSEDIDKMKQEVDQLEVHALHPDHTQPSTSLRQRLGTGHMVALDPLTASAGRYIAIAPRQSYEITFVDALGQEFRVHSNLASPPHVLNSVLAPMHQVQHHGTQQGAVTSLLPLDEAIAVMDDETSSEDWLQPQHNQVYHT